MNNDLYKWYEEAHNILLKLQKENPQSEGLKDSIEHWDSLITDIEKSYPEIVESYNRIKKIKKSFTHTQIDHICYQIGEWYLMMKPLLEGQHNLGYMKEKLKTMICGE